MDPEIFHEKFIAAIKNKDNEEFATLLPKIATRNEKFRRKYFYTAGCFGTDFMVDALMRYVSEHGADLYDTLYDALNYNNTETVTFLVPHIKRDIHSMVAAHIALERNFNIENIKIVAQSMSVCSLSHMIWKVSKNSDNLEERLEQVWVLVDPKEFFSAYPREKIEQLDNIQHCNFLMQKYDLHTALVQNKTISAAISDTEATPKILRKM